MHGKVIWITGLSGAGKTSLATEIVEYLRTKNETPILLDGDIFRSILKAPTIEIDEHNRESRISLAFRYGLMCQLLASQGATVVIATISMFEEVYNWNRTNLPNYFEIFLKVPLSELRNRDPKSIYEKFDNGELKNVAGLDLLVDEPKTADLTIDFENQPDIWESKTTLTSYSLLKLREAKIL